VIETPLLRRNVTICWPVASLTMFARVRLRKARFASGREARQELERVDDARVDPHRLVELRRRHAERRVPAGRKSYRPPEVGDPRADAAREAAEVAARRREAKSRSSVPKPSSKILFQL
jgi:hypothetical protein